MAQFSSYSNWLNIERLNPEVIEDNRFPGVKLLKLSLKFGIFH
jgi:hypothetical protein